MWSSVYSIVGRANDRAKVVTVGYRSNKIDKKLLQEKREKLVEHLLEHGWMVNYKYIEMQKNNMGKLKKTK